MLISLVLAGSLKQSHLKAKNFLRLLPAQLRLAISGLVTRTGVPGQAFIPVLWAGMREMGWEEGEEQVT